MTGGAVLILRERQPLGSSIWLSFADISREYFGFDGWHHQPMETLIPASHLFLARWGYMQTIARPERIRLNSIESSDWLSFTKTWFILDPPPRIEKVSHPATFPTKLARDFINFFTKPGDWVIDPFLGSGSTLVAGRTLRRNGVGIELYRHFSRLARRCIAGTTGDTRNVVLQGDASKVLPLLRQRGFPEMDFCLTSPPYWCQLNAKASTNEKAQERSANGLRVCYGDDTRDLGNIQDYGTFISRQEEVFRKLLDVMKVNSYMVVITNNVYRNGRLYPLAFDTLKSLSKFWTPKDEKIWCQNDKRLRPFGMFHSYIGNRSHHYCLVFKKESQFLASQESTPSPKYRLALPESAAK